MSTSDDKLKALDAAMNKINKEFSKNGTAIRKLGGKDDMSVERIPIGCLTMDIALGGGLPKGRVIEIYGPESSGKTLLCLTAIASVQASGGVAAFIDAEHALDPAWAEKNGVVLNELLVSQPDDGEQALAIAEMLVLSNAVDLIVIDSVSALTPRAEIEGDMDQASVGLQARLMSRALRKLTASMNKTQTTVIFINQLREKIGVMFGSPETTSGGKALKFYASVRMDIRKIELLKNGTEAIGHVARVKVVKNKVSQPFREAKFDVLYYGDNPGINREAVIRDLAVDHELINKAGAFYKKLDGTMIGQGKDKAREYLIENKDFADELEATLRAKLFGDPDAKESTSDVNLKKSEVSLDSLPDE